jgi:gliding motility-associated-like protein
VDIKVKKIRSKNMLFLKNSSFLLFLFTSFTSLAQSNAGTLTSSTNSVCYDPLVPNSGTITAAGTTGGVVRWEYSANGGDPWTPIVNSSMVYNFTNLAQTTHFRIVVQFGSNPIAVSTVPAVISVALPSLPGIISGQNTECMGYNELMTLSGTRGAILRWESSPTGTIWTPVAQSNDSLVKNQIITSNIIFRSVVKNGACPTLTSPLFNVAVKSPSLGGAVLGIDSVCSSGNAVVLNVSAFNGDQWEWQSALTQTGPWNVLLNTTTTLNITNLLSTQYYRVKVKNDVCDAVFSTIKKVDVSQTTIPGTISGVSEVCEIFNFIELNLNNNLGRVIRWETSINNGLNWVNQNVTTPFYSDNNISVTKLYRALVQNNFCAPAYTVSKQVTVNNLPNVGFTFLNTCEDRNVLFTNTTAGINTSVWEFGDGTGTTSPNANHSFHNSGQFYVRLIATSNKGCVDSLRLPITIFPSPEADFDFDDTTCFGNITQFTNLSQLSSGTFQSYAWTFGDGQISTLLNPANNFVNFGSYTTTLKVQSSFGCKDSISKQIFISAKPVANFFVENVCEGSITSIQNLTQIDNGTLSYAWNFGNGVESNLSNPSFTYASPGTYYILLEVQSNFLCKDTLIKTVVINPQPVVDFTAMNDCRYNALVFVPVITNSPNNTYAWNFGDGQNSTSLGVSHLYDSPGTFAVNFMVSSDSNCVTSVTKNSIVYPVPVVNFAIANVCIQDSAYFQNFSTISNGSLNYVWDFDNMVTSSNINPAVKFDTSQVYQVSLIATSNYGCKDTLVSPITVYDAPIVNFSFQNVCDGYPITFTNQSSVNYGSITSVLWDFGDNSNATLNNPLKDYMNFGDYSVVLTITSSNGCIDTAQRIASVYEGPIAKFTAETVCFKNETQFQNQTLLSTGVFNSSWNFGDSILSNQFAPLHSYTYPKNFLAQLIVTTNRGCVDSISQYVQVYALPKVNAGKDTVTDKGFEIQLNASGAIDYTWFPFDGLTSALIADPIARPMESIQYTLVGTDQNGCVNFDTLQFTVTDAFRVIPYNILTPDGNLQNDTWIIDNIDFYSKNTIYIYNELGNEVFNTKGYKNDWTGINKTGEILPDGTYFYILTFDESQRIYKGDLTLLRNKK